MRSLLALLAVATLALSLAGCTTSNPAADLPEPDGDGFQDALFTGAPDQGSPAGQASAHGEPQRDDGTVETGMTPPLQLPGLFWARRTITIANDFGGASLGHVFAGVDAGAITVETADADGYSIEVVVQAQGLTEQDARDGLDRVEVTHTDTLEADGLHLSTVAKQRDPASPLPLVVVDGDFAWAEMHIVLPAAPAYELGADTSYGEISVTGLRGPSLRLTTSSGGISVADVNAGTLEAETSSGDIDLDTVQASDLTASASSGHVTGQTVRAGKAMVDTSSGDIDLQGAFDTLEADASSGGITLDAHARHSGAYKLSTSSGNVDATLLTGAGRAYHVKAAADSGEVTVDLDGSGSGQGGRDRGDATGGHADVVSDGFDSAPIQTIVDVETSSGDITVTGSGADAGTGADAGSDGGSET
jgi:hypothetical protein